MTMQRAELFCKMSTDMLGDAGRVSGFAKGKLGRGRGRSRWTPTALRDEPHGREMRSVRGAKRELCCRP